MKPFPFRVTLFFIVAFMLVIAAHPASPASNGVLAAADRAIPPVAQPPAPVHRAPVVSNIDTTPLVRTLGAYAYGIPRPDDPTLRTPRVVVLTADAWVSPKEGRVVVSKGEGRWHRAGAWRRVL